MSRPGHTKDNQLDVRRIVTLTCKVLKVKRTLVCETAKRKVLWIVQKFMA